MNKTLYFKPTASNDQGEIYGEDGKTIAVIYDKTDGYGELFASAPELLEALKEWHNIYEWGLKTGAIKIEDVKSFSDKCTRLIERADGRDA